MSLTAQVPSAAKLMIPEQVMASFFYHFLHSHLILQSWLPLGLCHLYVQGGSAGVHIKQARHGVNPTKNRMT